MVPALDGCQVMVGRKVGFDNERMRHCGDAMQL
jgi:hypothetical protein